MIIVAGQIIVEQGRRAAGCLAVASGADLVDPGRVNIFERWGSRAALDAHRGGGGPDDEQGAAMRSASVADCDVADARPFFEQGTP